MFEWNESVAKRPGALTAISDVYKAMQSRLDGYRQGAGAVMIGVIAAALAVDSGFVRSLLDENLLKALDNRPDHYFYFVVGGAATLVLGICIVGLWIIHDIGKYFSEMTSVVHKIDEANKMWDVDYWFKGQPFYPKNFRVIRDRSNPLARDTANVTRDPAVDPVLIGWHDPTIKRYRNFTVSLIILHLVFFSCLLLLRHYSHSTP